MTTPTLLHCEWCARPYRTRERLEHHESRCKNNPQNARYGYEQVMEDHGLNPDDDINSIC